MHAVLQRALFPFWVYSTWLARRRAREKKVQSWIKARGAPTPAPRAACSVTLLWRRSARVFLPLGAPGAAKPATTMTRCRESKAHACTRRHTQPRARAHIQVEPWRWVGGGGQGEGGSSRLASEAGDDVGRESPQQQAASAQGQHQCRPESSTMPVPPKRQCFSRRSVDYKAGYRWRWEGEKMGTR